MHVVDIPNKRSKRKEGGIIEVMYHWVSLEYPHVYLYTSV